jgi:flavin-dependent dehydrogenase
VARLSDSVAVLGMGDVVVANDPVTGQGSNNAVRCAEMYFRSIVEHGDRAFDVDWMRRTFETYWEYARHPTEYTNMILGPLPDHVQKILGVAVENEAVAHRFVYGSADPTDFANWLMDPAKTEEYLASVTPAGQA